uniref:RNA-dependent RNA polymerase n=1 Tax=Ohio negev-like virus 2 TaxID=2789605 RepID=A0A7T1LYR4_9VIRU|nr:RNA-dependent RNA polymerase [Ohio negev-like virus 2]
MKKIRKEVSLGYTHVRLNRDIRAKLTRPDIREIFSKVRDMGLFIASDEYVPSVDVLLNKHGIRTIPNARPMGWGIKIEVTNSFPMIMSDRETSIVADINMVLNKIFGANIMVDKSLDSYSIHNSDATIVMEDVTMTRIRGVYHSPKYNCMRPVIRSTCPPVRMYTARESILAIAKRNKNVPELATLNDPIRTGKCLLNSFVVTYMKNFKNYPLIRVDYDGIVEWLMTQNTDVAEKIIPKFDLHRSDLTEFSLSIKRKPKPALNADTCLAYTALQTICFSEKFVNAIYCVIFREIRDRVLDGLKSKFKIFTNKSPHEFSGDITRVLDVSDIEKDNVNVLELDISKYDKSQNQVTLEYECELMRYFGVPEEFVQLWFNMHFRTRLVDRANGVSTRVAYQRKSGDASTFIGNTLFLMAVVARELDHFPIKVGLFAGDDSLIVLKTSKAFRMDTESFSMKYNLEVKQLVFKRSLYFCSKFLVHDGHRWVLVPDPVKIFVKLGRTDLRNADHVEEFRRSVADLVYPYISFAVCDKVASALCDRYDLDCNIAHLLHSFCGFCESAGFNKLFYSLPGDVLLTEKTFYKE